MGEVCRRVALRAAGHTFGERASGVDPLLQSGDRLGEIDGFAARTLVERSLHLGYDAEHREPCRPQHRRRAGRSPAVLGRLRRLVPVAEREVDIGRRGIANGLVPAVDRAALSAAASWASARSVSPRRAASIAFARARRSRPTGSVSASGWRASTPATSVHRPRRIERLRGERVEVAAEAAIEAGELTLRDRVEGRVERVLVLAGVAECDAQVQRGQGATLRVGGSGHRGAAQFDRCCRVALVAADDAQHAPRHPHASGLSSGGGTRSNTFAHQSSAVA